MDDIFVDIDLSVKLSKIGFNERCIGAYDIYSMLHTINSNDKFSLDETEISAYAPTFEQALGFFRNVGLYGNVVPNFSRDSFYIEVYKETDMVERIYIRGNYESYHTARNVLLNKLIDIYTKIKEE